MEPEQKRDFFGMSPTEIAILIILVIVILVIGGFFAKMILDNSSGRISRQSSNINATSTLAVSDTPTPEPTRPPSPTPIPGWNKFEFAIPPGEIWLPEGYEGGDTITYPDVVLLSAEVFVEDQEFIDDVKNLIEIPEVVFFAFDSNSTGVIRFVYVMGEPIDPDFNVTLDDYMNALANNAKADGTKLVGRTIMPMDRYQVGRTVIENEVPAGEFSAWIHLTIYSIHLEDVMWNIAFRTGRDEFNDYLPVMENVVNTFVLHP
jgi:hypothetical protein